MYFILSYFFRTLDIKEEDDDKDDIQAFSPPTNYITISQGKIQLVHQQRSQESDISDEQNRKDRVSPYSKIEKGYKVVY